MTPYDLIPDDEREVLALALEHEADRVRQLDGLDALEPILYLSSLRLKLLGHRAIRVRA